MSGHVNVSTTSALITARMRLRKWGTVVATAAVLHGGGGDPLTSALDYAEHVASKADIAERVTASSAPSRSTRSAMPALLSVILQHETLDHDYTAFNPTGCSDENGTFSCGGAYQLSAQYASVWAERAGYSGMSSNAATWPPSTQDAVALELFYSTVPDGAHWCVWTDYC